MFSFEPRSCQGKMVVREKWSVALDYDRMDTFIALVMISGQINRILPSNELQKVCEQFMVSFFEEFMVNES